MPATHCCRWPLVSITFCLSVAAHAQGTAEQRRACTLDAVRFCQSAIPNPDLVAECLHENRLKLKEACAKHLPPRTSEKTDKDNAATDRSDR
jgi:hypothetical protein